MYLKDLTVKESYGKRILTWELDAYNEEEASYELHRSESADFTPTEETLIKADLKAAEGLYIDNEITEEGVYRYKIIVKDKTGTQEEKASSEVP